jgi:hypothetical protein
MLVVSLRGGRSRRLASTSAAAAGLLACQALTAAWGEHRRRLMHEHTERTAGRDDPGGPTET